MSVINRVKHLLTPLPRRGDGGVVCECRRCGTTVDTDAETCPGCGAAAIATYHVN